MTEKGLGRYNLKETHSRLEDNDLFTSGKYFNTPLTYMLRMCYSFQIEHTQRYGAI